VLAALQATVGGIDQSVFKAGSCLSGGVVGRGETCGALTGGMLAIGAAVGRERLEDIPQLRAARAIATELYERFGKEVGHTLCAEVHRIKFGRPYRLYDPEEFKAFEAAGGHDASGCPDVCRAAARITADMLLRLRQAT